jgi:hypothetical protein
MTRCRTASLILVTIAMAAAVGLVACDGHGPATPDTRHPVSTRPPASSVSTIGPGSPSRPLESNKTYANLDYLTACGNHHIEPGLVLTLLWAELQSRSHVVIPAPVLIFVSPSCDVGSSVTTTRSCEANIVWKVPSRDGRTAAILFKRVTDSCTLNIAAPSQAVSVTVTPT